MYQLTHTIFMDTTDYAYAAGYIDGDGCFQIGNQKWGSHLVIVSIRKEPIMWFAERFDGSIRAIQPRTSNRSVSYHFRFSVKGLNHLRSISFFLVEKTYECLNFQHFRSHFGEELKEFFTERMHHIKENYGLIKDSIKEELNSLRNTILP